MPKKEIKTVVTLGPETTVDRISLYGHYPTRDGHVVHDVVESVTEFTVTDHPDPLPGCGGGAGPITAAMLETAMNQSDCASSYRFLSDTAFHLSAMLAVKSRPQITAEMIGQWRVEWGSSYHQNTLNEWLARRIEELANGQDK